MSYTMSAMLVGAVLLALTVVPTPADARAVPGLGAGSFRHLTQAASNATGPNATASIVPLARAAPTKYPSAWHAMGRPVPPQNATSAQPREVEFKVQQAAPQAPAQKTYTVAGLPIAALGAIVAAGSTILMVVVGSSVACCYFCHRRRQAEMDVLPDAIVKGSYTSSGGGTSRTASQLDTLKEEQQQV